MSRKNWWFQFDFRVWRTDSNLRRCSLETRGFWLEVLCAMHEADEYIVEGSFEEIGWLIGCSPEIVARCSVELQRTKTADVTLGNGFVTLLSRRMERELNERKQTLLRVKKHRNVPDVTPCNALVTELKRDKVINKSKKEEIRKDIHNTRARETSLIPDPKDIAWDWPMRPLIEAFPDYLPDRINPSFVGHIEADIKPGDELAWSQTIELYKQNFDPMLNRYLPDKAGTILSVFRKKKAELEAQQNYDKNGKSDTGRRNGRGNSQTTEEYLASIGARPA